MKRSEILIMDSAERIVLRDGVSCLTLDAVAAETGMSKGGVLYHFPSKDALIRGMIRRLIEEFDAEVDRLAAADPWPVGRRLRAMINTSFPKSRSDRAVRTDRVSAALLAAVAKNRDLLDDLKEASTRAEKAILNEGLDPVTAMIVHMAADGIWMAGLFGMRHPSGELCERVVDRLRIMSKGGATNQ